MSELEVLALGAVAGGTIFLGLPLGRVRSMPIALRALLNAIAAGVLLFLFVETAEHGFAPAEQALLAITERSDDWGLFVGRGLLFLGCVGAGALSLVYYDRWMARRGRAAAAGPGAASTAELSLAYRIEQLPSGQRLALFIALGIGLHNFSEGLAIGQSAARDQISLAVLLIVGFAVHNSTESFGIVGPIASDEERPSWRFLGLCGLIGGGPTFVGTLVGRAWASDWLDIAFLSLAAGSILYVIAQLLGVGWRLAQHTMLIWGIFVGVMLGFGTELVLVAAGV